MDLYHRDLRDVSILIKNIGNADSNGFNGEDILKLTKKDLISNSQVSIQSNEYKYKYYYFDDNDVPLYNNDSWLTF